MKISMTLIKRDNGVYYIVWRDNGKQRWKSLKTKDKRQANILFNHFKRAYLEGKLIKLDNAIKRITLTDFLDEFLNYISNRLRNNSIDSYTMILDKFNNFIVYNYGCDFLLKNINSKIIDQYIDYCKKERSNKNITINKDLRHLRTFFNKAIEYNYLLKFRTS